MGGEARHRRQRRGLHRRAERESGAGKRPGVRTDGVRKTGKATSVGSEEVGAGGRHGAMHGVRERAPAGGKTCPESPQELETRTGTARPMECPASPLE